MIKERVKVVVSRKPPFSLQSYKETSHCFKRVPTFSFLSGPEKADQFCDLLCGDCQPAPCERLLLSWQLLAG